MGHGLWTQIIPLAGFGLSWLFQSSLLLTLGLLGGRVVRRSGPAVQSTVYRTALAAVLVSPLVSALLMAVGVRGLTVAIPTTASVETEAERLPVPAPSAPIPAPASASDRHIPAVASLPAPQIETAYPPTIGPATVFPGNLPASVPARRSYRTLLPMGIAAVLTAWGLVSFLLVGRLLVGLRRLATLRERAAPAEAEAVELCRGLACRMGVRAPAVLRTPFLFSPCLAGIRRPAILLPDDVSENLPDTLVHELAHLARHDGHWNVLRQVATSVFWIQPLLWMLSRRLEAAAEEVCDDIVVHHGADRTRYASLLLELAGRTLPALQPAGVGMVSLRSMLARRVVRILDPTRALSTRAGARALVAVLAGGCAVTLLAGLLGVGGARRDVLAEEENGTKRDGKRETVRGLVVGPDGRPFADALVTAARVGIHPEEVGEANQPARRYELARATADRTGRFEISFDGPKAAANDDPAAPRVVDVIATAPGYGLGYSLNRQPIRLSRGDVPITGRLVDQERRPVAGARVRLRQVYVLDEDDRREANARPGPYRFPENKALGIDGEPVLPGGVTTDRDGRFRIEGLGRDTKADLEISGPGVVFRRVEVLTRTMSYEAGPPVPPEVHGVNDPGTYGADCTIALEPSRPIEGIVRDADTQQPIPHAVVTAAQLAGSTLNIEGLISAETDAEGRYRLSGVPEGSGHTISIYPPLDRPYFPTRFLKVDAGPGPDPVRFDVALRRGTWIVGRVTDKSTGRPVRASVDYYAFLTNEHAKGYPNFRPGVTSIEVRTRYRTDRGGRFRVVGLPGRGVVTVRADERGYRAGVGADAIRGRAEQKRLLTYDRIWPQMFHAVKEVQVAEGAAETACDLTLDPGGLVTLRLVDPGGKPVPGATAVGRYPDGLDAGDTSLGEDSIAKVAGLEPRESRRVVLRDDEHKLGAVVVLPPGSGYPPTAQTVTLRPYGTLTGRLLDEAGKPVKGAVRVILPSPDPDVFADTPLAGAPLAAKGQFRCTEVPAGRRYRLEVTSESSPKVRGPMLFAELLMPGEIDVKGGEVVDLGTIHARTQGRVVAPDQKAAAATVPITGRVVDPDGRPVAGAKIDVRRIHRPKGNDLTRWIEAVKGGAPPWVAYGELDGDEAVPEAVRRAVTTDGEGRFRIDGVGPERVVDLALQGENVVYTTFSVVTRKAAPIAARGFARTHGPGTETVYGADFTLSAAPSRPVEGRITDAKTGRPLAGLEVRSYRFAGSDFVGIMTLKTKTDDDGRFRLIGLPKGNGNTLLLVPADDQPYLMQELGVPDPPGTEPVHVTAALPRGIFIEGRLTEKATGKPVSGAWLHYLPFLENTYAQAHPAFNKDGNTAAVGFQDRYQSKADGSFRLVGVRGRAIVGALVHGKPYLQGAGAESITGTDKSGFFATYRNPINPGTGWPTVMTEINPPSDSKSVRVDLQVISGGTVRLKVVDPEGKPAAGASVEGGRPVDAGGMSEVSGLRPDETRSVVVRHDGRKLGVVVRVRLAEGADKPLEVKLAPLATITGRTVDAKGHPVAGASIRVDVQPSSFFVHQLAKVATDADGRFTVTNVPVGCEYGLVAESGPPLRQWRVAFGSARVKPGESSNVGDLVFKND